MARGIPENLHAAVAEKHAKGFSTREIAEWLKEAHEVDVNHATVARTLQKGREARAPIAQQIAREQLEEHVPRDLERSDLVWDDLRRLQSEAAAVEAKGDEETIANFRLRQINTQGKLLETQRRLLMDRARMAGLVEPEPAPSAPLDRFAGLPDETLEQIAALDKQGGADPAGA